MLIQSFSLKSVALRLAAAIIVFLGAITSSHAAGSGTSGDPFTALSDAYGVSSGRYHFNTGSGVFQADVDNSEGGGWVLALQYVHQANDNSPLTIIGAGANLPVTSTATLGADESGVTARWGHAGNSAMAQFPGDIELRWYGETSNHTRKIHFRSSVGDDYWRTGIGSAFGIRNNFTALSNHTANVPAAINSNSNNEGDLALTELPFHQDEAFHWSIKGLGNRWEVDDFTNDESQDTIHRVWVRQTRPLVVTSTVDTFTFGTLRYAVNHANQNPAEDTITFDIPGSGPHVISLTSSLLDISDPGVTIDGSTQSGASCGQLTTGTQHDLRIRLDLAGAGSGAIAIETAAADVSIKGLSITNAASHAIKINSGADNFVLDCAYIGVAPDGVTKGPNATQDNTNPAIRVTGISNATVRNSLISGNDRDSTDDGLRFESVTGGVIEGNIIGLNAAGTGILGNADEGVLIDGTTSGLIIGGTTAAKRNLISGNGDNGVLLSGASNVDILGNYIGLGTNGTSAFANANSGVAVAGSTTLKIGNGAASGRNIISGNTKNGIELSGTIDSVVIDGNYIGLAADGDTARGNVVYGISFDTATSDGDIIRNNLISGNGIGIHSLNGSVNNLLLTGNYVGTDATGLLPRGNIFSAMIIDDGANGWTVGTPASGNIFAATLDSGAGVESYAGAHTFQNNKIGVGVDGTTALGNEGWGLRLYGGPHLVGGIGFNEGNIIANSGSNTSFANLIVQGSGSATVSGNIIRDGVGYAGLDLSSTGTVVTFQDNTVTNNLGAGIQVNSGTQLFAFNNIISNNSDVGVRFGGATANAAIYSNSIFGNAGLGIDFGAGGVTANDIGDGDTGPNDLLNFPVINSFGADGTTSANYDINLDVPSDANGYRIEFFKNANLESHGEGEFYLGSVDVAHAGGDINFTGSFTSTEAISVGDYISATTTRKTGAASFDITSEFAETKTANAPSSPLIVTNTNNAGAGSLRDAILFANANPGEDFITFNLPTSDPNHSSGVWTISPTSSYILSDDGINIDASTQPGATCGINVDGNGVLTDRNLAIEIDATNSAGDVIIVNSNGVTIKGLAIGRTANFNDSAIDFDSGSSGTVVCNHLGTAADGMTTRALEGFAIETGAFGDGVADSVQIGDGSYAGRNVIANTRRAEIQCSENSVTCNIRGNYIGVFADGFTPGTGISNNTVWIGGYNSVVGGPTAPERNIIGLSVDTGIALSNGPAGITIVNNYIGVAADGVTVLDPSLTGTVDAIEDSDTAQTLFILRIRNNVIGGFPQFGIDLTEATLFGSSITGNKIGVGADGVADVGVGVTGIALGATTNTSLRIGDTNATDRNVIGFMSENGIQMDGTSGVTIRGNYIGVGADGVTPAGNGDNGIFANGVTNVTLGNGAASGRNVISGNTNDGIKLSGTIDGVVIDGNYIGLGADGDTPLGNAAGSSGGAGIYFDTATSDGEIIRNNVISANEGGVYSLNGSVVNTVFTGNYVGTDATGLLPRGNQFYGVLLDAGADGWTIGTPASGNIVSATDNNGAGLEIYVGGHVIQNNLVGVGADSTIPLGNEGWGIRLFEGPHVVGGTGFNEGNIIANTGASYAALLIQEGSGVTSTASGNIIRDGLGYAGVNITDIGTTVIFHDNIITNEAGAGIQLNDGVQLFAYNNRITGNGESGIRLDAATSKAAIYANRISGNVGLGIELAPLGVTPNDAGDGDAGANDLLNFPVINSFSADGTTSANYDINLDVPSDANGYRIDFFKTTTPDATHGEGEVFLGFIDVPHAGGDLNFTGTFTTAAAVSSGESISATTTRKTGSLTYDITSEFSANKMSIQSNPASLTVTKTVASLVPGEYAIPGNDMVYSFEVVNQGGGSVTADSIVLIDLLPPEVKFFNGDYDGAGPSTAVIGFEETGSSLTFDPTTDALYSDSATKPDNISECNYTPSAGYDGNVTYVCFNPKGEMLGGNPNPSFEIHFRAGIE